MSSPAVEMWCGQCNKQVMGGEQFIDWQGKNFHAHCFSCTKCRKPLGSERFCTHSGHLYCQTDYDNLFGKKCSECDQVIDGQMVEDGHGGFLHPHCLKCALCGKPIGGEDYFPNDQGTPYCSTDCKHKAASMPTPAPAPAHKTSSFSPVVIKVHNDTCSACNQTVYNLDKIEVMNRLWHKKCFKCATCQLKLTPNAYQSSNGKPYCNVHYPKPAPTSLPL